MSFSGFILAGWLIDGSGGEIKKHVFLQIKDGHIRQIKTSLKNDIDQSNLLRRSNLLDLSHCTILPGLVDSHVHLSMSGTDNQQKRKDQLSAGFSDVKDVISRHIESHISCGVLAVRDGGDNHAHAFRYKKECLNPDKTPMCLKVAGRAWHKAGRYGGLIGRSPHEKETLAGSIAKEKENPDQVNPDQRNPDQVNPDHVKIVMSGLNSLTEFGKQTPPQFDLEEMKKAVDTAHAGGLRVMVHANGKIPVSIAVDACCDSIEHGFFMGRENLIKMADKNITWVPTAYTMKAYAEYLKPGSLEVEISKRNLDHQLKQIFTAKKLGVPIATGTDAGSLGVHHGRSIIEELKLLMSAGFPIQEAIRCATCNGAELIGLKKQGLSAGKMPANFITVTGNPEGLPGSLSSCTIYNKSSLEI